MYTIQGLRNTKIGKRAAIIACGPSLRGFDLRRLLSIGFVSVGVNRSIWACSPDYWIATEFKDVFLKMLSDISIKKTVAIVRKKAEPAARLISGLKYYTYEVARGPGLTMALDPIEIRQYDEAFSRGEFFSYASVTIGAIELCRFLGISDIFLFGVDCRLGRRGEYYFNSNWKPNITDKFQTIVSGGKKDTLLIHDRMKRGYQFAKKWIWGGMNIVNVSPGSFVDAFPIWSHERFWEHIESS